jgi:hypothetical protein
MLKVKEKALQIAQLLYAGSRDRFPGRPGTAQRRFPFLALCKLEDAVF